MIKRWKLLSFISAFTLSLLLCFTSTSDVNAFNLGATGRVLLDAGYGYSSIQVYTGNYSGQGPGPYYTVPLTRSADSNYLTANTNTVDAGGSGNLTAVDLRLNDTLPASTLFNFSVRYLTANYAHAVEYRLAESSSDWTIINSNCVETASMDNVSNNSTFTSGLTCSYWGYTSTALNRVYLQPSIYHAVPLIVQTSNYVNYARIVSESGGGSSGSGLTQADKDYLSSLISSLQSSGNTNTQSILSAISSITSGQTTLNQSIQSLRSDTQAQTDMIEQGNEEAQDRWEADKQEEADREEQGSEDMDDLTSTFNFEIRNPFAGLLTMFTNNCPVNIPIIAGMVGATSSVYPCWFSQQTRSILTPVFGLSSSMLLFGYIVRKFLNGSTFNDTMEF